MRFSFSESFAHAVVITSLYLSSLFVSFLLIITTRSCGRVGGWVGGWVGLVGWVWVSGFGWVWMGSQLIGDKNSAQSRSAGQVLIT